MADWYVKTSASDEGPISSAELKRRADQGRVEPETLVRRGSDDHWVAAHKVKGLFQQDEAIGKVSSVAKPEKPRAPVRCSKCGKKYALSGNLGGKSMDCPGCGGKLAPAQAKDGHQSVPTPTSIGHLLDEEIAVAAPTPTNAAPDPSSLVQRAEAKLDAERGKSKVDPRLAQAGSIVAGMLLLWILAAVAVVLSRLLGSVVGSLIHESSFNPALGGSRETGADAMYYVLVTIPSFVGLIVAGIFAIRLIVLPFYDTVLQGVLCLLVPFYMLYFIASRREEMMPSFLFYLLGISLMLFGVSCGLAAWGKTLMDW